MEYIYFQKKFREMEERTEQTRLPSSFRSTFWYPSNHRDYFIKVKSHDSTILLETKPVPIT